MRALVLTIDQPCGWLLPNRALVLPDLAGLVYKIVGHFADKVIHLFSSALKPAQSV